MLNWFKKNKKESSPNEKPNKIKVGVSEIVDGFYKKNYALRGEIINFKAKISDYDSTQVEMGQYLVYVNSAPQKTLAPLQYFSEDIDDYFSLLNEYKNLDFQTYMNVIKRKCRKHIDSYNRLIDSDLSGYVQSLMLIINHLQVSDGFFELSYEEGKKLRAKLVDSVLNEFPSYIFIYISMKPLMPPELTPFNKTGGNKGFQLQ